MKNLKNLFDALNEKPIAYHRAYANITGSITAGLLLSQLVYWAKAMNYKEFYKTDKDFREELGMGEYEFKGAKKKLIQLKLVKIKVKGIPAKTYYEVDLDKLITLLTRWGKTTQLDGGKSPNKIVENQPTTTENTTENTTDIISSEQSSQVNKVLNEFYEINPTLNYGNKTQRKAVEDMIKKWGTENLIGMIKKYREYMTEKYMPVATTPIAFKNKIGDIKVGIDKLNNNPLITNVKL